MQNKIFLWITLVTGLLLLIPLLMQFNWTLSDYIVAGTLLFGAASIFVVAARQSPKHRVAIGITVLIGLLWLWVELAIGLLTNWGS